ncbi:2-succinyl-6-hydroxy-2,4-cyclohexadiene-1-carboxylate synthase [Chamaesiphon sp. VAR_48_metabat_135_sub]|uniref:2-succinyl-6-hydroxy-2, 4-cyclohexadiene-1-carboxylate synthase n=1 Tax=Chamaesiphon sp. VAR_48_metabat_135_sub TaxID=2964699 RepID=UPI00286D4191|nr:2-succinyl-6-hydroxy-2,4-cyclohexadiene-1-carboxylate synthase [Chamaesiphon sp. VAR_48_metabat_135_sub]
MYQWQFTLTGDINLPPLLLLHGWMGSCRDYAEIIELLRSRFYCIAIDLPGHGKTEVTSGDRGYGFVNTAIGIVQLLDSLEINRCSIAGYSFGGRLALYLALEFPDRFDRVMLESTSPGLATEIDRQARIIQDWQIIDRLETDNFPDFVQDWYRQSIFIGIENHPNFSDLIQRRIETNQPDSLIKSLEYAGVGMQPYLGDRLKVHTKPISLIVGEIDCKFVTINQTIHRDSPLTDIKIIPNCSHNVHFQQPQAWIDLWVQKPDFFKKSGLYL